METKSKSLKEISLLKLLLFLHEKERTGSLSAKNEDTLKIIYFQNGQVKWVFSNSPEDNLETILISEQLVRAEVLVQIKREMNHFQSLGQILLDKGLITPEKLQNCYYQKMENVLTSILKWEEGECLFVEETPPQSLYDLKLDLLHFLFRFIVFTLNLPIIQKELGQPHLKLIKNAPADKIKTFNLTEKQFALLNHFEEETLLDDVLGRYSKTSQELLLRTLYYFYINNLLIQSKSGSSFVNEIDRQFTMDFLTPGIPLQEEKFQYAWKEPLPKKAEPIRRKPESNETIEFQPPQSTTSSLKPFFLLLTFLVLVVGITAILYLTIFKEPSPEPPIFPEPEAIAEAEWVPMPQKNISMETILQDLYNKVWFPEDQAVASTIAISEPTQLSAEKPAPPPQPEKISKPVESLTIPSPKAWALFQSKNLKQASQAWTQEIKSAGIKFGILLEMDCQEESVWDAYEKIKEKNRGEFYLLKKMSNGRYCYLVMWGKYTTAEAASSALETIPPFFWSQPNPPIILELKFYL